MSLNEDDIDTGYQKPSSKKNRSEKPLGKQYDTGYDSQANQTSEKQFHQFGHGQPL